MESVLIKGGGGVGVKGPKNMLAPMRSWHLCVSSPVTPAEVDFREDTLRVSNIYGYTHTLRVSSIYGYTHMCKCFLIHDSILKRSEWLGI